CCRTAIDCAVAYYGTYIEHRIREAKNLHRPFVLHMALKDRWVQAEVNELLERRLSPHPLVTIHKYPGADHAFARYGGKTYSKPGAGRALALTLEFFNIGEFRDRAILRLRESALQESTRPSPHGALQSWRAAMEHYVGLDVSLKLTAICIVDRTGKIEREGVVASDPETIAAFIRSHAPHVARVGLETGATSTWLWTELNKMGLPAICIDARHAKAALKLQINKSDRNDAVGIARIMQCGWYKEVRVKDLDSHALKALLVSRALLVKI